MLVICIAGNCITASYAITVIGRTPTTVFLCPNLLETCCSKMPAATRQETTTGLIAFGSNQGNSMQVFQASIEALQKTAHVSVSAHSQPIWTEPVTGKADSPGSSPATPTQTDKNPYLNAVIRIELGSARVSYTCKPPQSNTNSAESARDAGRPV